MLVSAKTQAMVTNRLVAILFFLTVFMVSCSVEGDLKSATNASALFRLRVANADFDSIYDDASSEFKATVTRDDLKRYLTDANPMIITPLNRQLALSKVSEDAVHGRMIVLRYTATYRGAVVNEQFVFAKKNQVLQLFHYQIQ